MPMGQTEEERLDILSDTVANVWNALLDSSTTREIAQWLEAHYDEDPASFQELVDELTVIVRLRAEESRS